MSGLSQSSTKSVKPRQLMIISFLAAVLVAVNVMPKGDDGPEISLPSPGTAGLTATRTVAHGAPPKEQRRAIWSDYTLDAVIAKNPFEAILAASVPTLEPDAQVIQRERDGLEENADRQPILVSNVDVIFQNATERVALIDSQIVRVGDMLPEGRIIEITPDNVVLDGSSDGWVREVD